MRPLNVRQGGPQLTVQDLGRLGFRAMGLSRGGAADRRALFEGAALLGQPSDCAAIEMAGAGGVFEAGADLRIALTGAAMSAEIDGQAVPWNASVPLPAGARLKVGGAKTGVYGYLHVGGGFETPSRLGSRSVHLAAGLGTALADGDALEVGPDAAGGETGYRLPDDDRFSGGTVRIVESLQTDRFSPEDRARFEATEFVRDRRGNRMGVRFAHNAEGFFAEGGLSVLSEAIVPGDIQVTGDGSPFVLLAECQTTGGYPRIGTVIPADLPRVVQAGIGAKLRFVFVSAEEATEIARVERGRLSNLGQTRERLVTRVEDVPDLLTRQLISGVTRGDDL